MIIFSSKKDLDNHLKPLRNKGVIIGLVPTMGALHQGHLSLVNKAVNNTDVVVVTIFVNPTQFDNQVDLEKYPQTLKEDVKLLETISKDILVFAPTKEDIYDGNVVSKSFQFDGLDKVMEGEFRKGHFNGVATIVDLLFDAVKPNKAYFGEKDFQQLQIIKKLVAQNWPDLEIIPCEILREENGLAMSSRNERLSAPTRKAASFIYKTLKTAKSMFGTKNAAVVTDWVKQQFAENEMFTLEYFQIADIDTLTPIQQKQYGIKYRGFIAVFAEDVRLIDNIALNY